MTAALATIAPATAWALETLRRRPAVRGGFGATHSIHGRGVLLALAALSDEALNSPAGYDEVTPVAIAAVTGTTPATVRTWLRALNELGLAVPGRRAGWRVPEEAFNR